MSCDTETKINEIETSVVKYIKEQDDGVVDKTYKVVNRKWN